MVVGHRTALALLIALLATACSSTADPQASDAPSPTGPTTEPGPQHVATITCTDLEELPGGAEVSEAPSTDQPFPWDRSDPKVREGFDPDAIIRGGPPPDGIEPIDDPCFVDVEAADEWLEPQSPVMVVEVDGDRRAYPLAIMTQHEIVNDVIGEQPVVVTYCPLCNSGLAFFRTLEGTVLDFGTSGRLFQANLVMYDRQTRSLWTQFTGQAVMGEQVPAELERLSTSLLGWEEFRETTPDGWVLSRASAPGRDYGRNPYPGYEDSGDSFLFQGPRDDRIDPNTRVVGLGAEEDPVTVPLPALRDQRVVRVEVGDQPVTVWWAPGQASALDAGTVADGEDVGSTGAFVPVLDDGTELTFAPAPDEPTRFVDDQTGSRWNLLGEAVDGELAGATLTSVPRDDTFWFVWFAFQPETRVAG